MKFPKADLSGLGKGFVNTIDKYNIWVYAAALVGVLVMYLLFFN